MARIERPAAAAIPPLLKDLNERTVLETIRSSAPVSRAEISRLVGISKPTVSLAIQSLVDAGLVREAAEGPDGPSYGAVFFEPVPDAALVLGFDLGARFLRGAICDLRGAIRARLDVEVAGSDAASVLDVIAALRDQLVETAGLSDALIDGVVVGVPGVVDEESGRIELATSVEGLEGIAFRPALRERLELPVTLENDVNLAALGEQWQGVARGVDDFVFLSIGTGMGAGLVLHGELHRGRHGAAGEVDFALVGLAQDVDPCAGAISTYATRVAAERTPVTTLQAPFDSREIFAAARAGDAFAHEIVDEVARRIALHLVPIAAVSDVSLAVLGGGLGANGDLLLRPVRELLAGWIPYPPQVDVSSLGEAAVLTGALAVGLRAALDNVFVGRPRRAAR
ncbi:MAG TPA: ROK family transcriptional regulator [Gaiellaceae bacterium]|jgi:predicted NBD/HSP70 family sugar kinase|nr:ROK family transcriptional regulator [Gaiellaceae bacterium]